MITRRQTLQLLGTATAAAFIATSLPALAQNVAVQDLAVQGPLGDVSLGPDNAKVTIIEYASLTCSHCAAFHKTTWPELKKRYIDTGKIRFTLREFPLFDQQRNWAFTDKPLDALRTMMRQAGFSQDKFDACLKDQKLYDAINAVKNRGVEQFKVDSTPTFFINGQRHPGNMSIDELEAIIKPLLGE
jgi:protein-disulfide isomerase